MRMDGKMTCNDMQIRTMMTDYESYAAQRKGSRSPWWCAGRVRMYVVVQMTKGRGSTIQVRDSLEYEAVSLDTHPVWTC